MQLNNMAEVSYKNSSIVNIRASIPSYYSGLEAIRGVTALMVVAGHIFYYKKVLDPNFAAALPGNWIPPAHAAVLLFFVLSGYVIGLSNPTQIRSFTAVQDYIKKRAVRLYPVYLVALAATTVVGHLDIWQQLGYLVFGQGLLTPNTWENNPLWSLHFEVLYYVVFLPLSFARVSAIKACIIALALGVLCAVLYPHVPAILSAYLLGFCFWSAGWALSKRTANVQQPAARHLVSGCLLLLTLGSIEVPTILPAHISNSFVIPESVDWVKRAITVVDLKLFPFCLWLVALGAGRQPRHQWIPVALYAWPVATIGFQVLQGVDTNMVLLPAFFWLLAALLYLAPATESLSAEVLPALGWVGSISYGVYALHFPLMVVFKHFFKLSGSMALFSLRLGVFFLLLFAGCYVLERLIQPRIKQFFFKKKVRPLLLDESVRASHQ